MGMKKFVLSSAMGLSGVYDDSERRCLRPATEWSLDTLMQRKMRVDSRKKEAVSPHQCRAVSVCVCACVCVRGMVSCIVAEKIFFALKRMLSVCLCMCATMRTCVNAHVSVYVYVQV
jgi:hypothetical protein